MGTKHNYHCEMCCNTFDQDDVHCPVCGNGMVTQAELAEAHKARRNLVGQAAAKLKAIYEDLVDYELPKEAPKQNPSYRDEPGEPKMWALRDMLLVKLHDAREYAEELESRLDERNQ